MARRVLILEDAPPARAAMCSALRNQGFMVAACDTRTDLVQALARVAPEVVVVGPLSRSSSDLVRLVRRHSRAAVLMLAGRATQPLQLRDADDCLRRPFTMIDLISRVRALARRPPLPAADLVIGDLIMSIDLTRVERAGHVVDLTRTERRLLGALALRCGVVVAKTDLMVEVWGDGDVDPNVVEVNISTLRRKLEKHGPRVVHTVRGSGYRLSAEV